MPKMAIFREEIVKTGQCIKYDFYLDTLYINRVWLDERHGMGWTVHAVG